MVWCYQVQICWSFNSLSVGLYFLYSKSLIQIALVNTCGGIVVSEEYLSIYGGREGGLTALYLSIHNF